MKTLKLRDGKCLLFIVVDKLEAFGESYAICNSDEKRVWLQVAGRTYVIDSPISAIVDQLYSGESSV